MRELEIINSIKETEEKAALILKEAQEEANKIILDAKLKAKERLHWQDADATLQAQKITELSQKELEEMAKREILGLEAKKQNLEKTARANLNEAVDFIKKRFFQKWQQPNLKR